MFEGSDTPNNKRQMIVDLGNPGLPLTSLIAEICHIKVKVQRVFISHNGKATQRTSEFKATIDCTVKNLCSVKNLKSTALY